MKKKLLSVQQTRLFFLYILIFMSIGHILMAEESKYYSVCRSLDNWETVNVKIKNSAGQWISLNAELADTEIKHNCGLMFRKYLPPNQGMLFVFPYQTQPSFWMKNTYLPLSIAYISEKGIIRQIYNMIPRSEKMYPSHYTVLFALEVNIGFFSRHGITEGAPIVIQRQ